MKKIKLDIEPFYDLDVLLSEDSINPLFTVEYCEPYEYIPYSAPLLDDSGNQQRDNDGNLLTHQPEPVWIDAKGKKHIDHPAFIENFARVNNLICCNGLFYTPEGVESETDVRKNIAYSLVQRGWKDRIDLPVNALFNALKYMKSVDELNADESIIPFADGDLHIEDKDKWVFRCDEKKQMPYRLGVKLAFEDEPMPKFEKWLHDLFVDEDILTIQEMLGYAMLPVTNVQEAFILVGDAAAGKSVLGHILGKIFGNSFLAITANDFVTQRFQIASAENKLVLYDDDLGTAALKETGLLKKLITADQPIPAERKYEKGFTFMSYAKIIACANFMLSSLYDDSDGFFRRLHPIEVKPKDLDRPVIPDFGKQIAEEESEQIARWALRGLKRLIENDWEITWSERSRNYIKEDKENSVHFPQFLHETLEPSSSPEDDLSCAEIRKLYERWCKANNFQDVKVRRMQSWMSKNSEKEGIKISRNVIREGKQVRGYKGVKVRPEWSNIKIL